MANENWFPLEEELQRLEREVPGVGRAAAGYRGMVDRLTGKGPGLSPSELARLYDVSQPLETETESAVLEAKPEREILSPDPGLLPPQDVSPGQS